MRADVAGAAGHQPGHRVLPYASRAPDSLTVRRVELALSVPGWQGPRHGEGQPAATRRQAARSAPARTDATARRAGARPRTSGSPCRPGEVRREPAEQRLARLVRAASVAGDRESCGGTRAGRARRRRAGRARRPGRRGRLRQSLASAYEHGWLPARPDPRGPAVPGGAGPAARDRDRRPRRSPRPSSGAPQRWRDQLRRSPRRSWSRRPSCVRHRSQRSPRASLMPAWTDLVQLLVMLSATAAAGAAGAAAVAWGRTPAHRRLGERRVGARTDCSTGSGHCWPRPRRPSSPPRPRRSPPRPRT